MKKLLFCFLLALSFGAQAQVFNNEWIDHSKTYYKFRIRQNGLYRLSAADLAAAGLGNVPAEQFQLWRNGAEVPLYTSVPAGALGGSDFIEFFGQMNDGAPDRELFREPDFHLSPRWSLLTDTAAYFLTVNAAGNNRRLAAADNNVGANTLPAEPYFMHTVGYYPNNRINNGYANNVGEL
ncbi:MAG TPA: hypothetical protein VHK69_08265, partial [Chitinophagaceae bacterium]|nr:hypothetical protein [Chitinophagaceae bacterium]